MTMDDRRDTDSKSRVLFLCTHNAARSQMAEAFLRHYAGDRFEVLSGPAGAFAQKHTVLHNVLSDNRLHGHKTAS